MKSNKRQHLRIIQFLRFGMVGVLNNVISLAVYYVVLFFCPAWYVAGYVLGFLISTLNAYFWNSRFVFRAGPNAGKRGMRLAKTYCTYTVSLCISTLLLFGLVDVMHCNARLAPLCALAVTVPLNYMLNRFWVYCER